MVHRIREHDRPAWGRTYWLARSCWIAGFNRNSAIEKRMRHASICQKRQPRLAGSPPTKNLANEQAGCGVAACAGSEAVSHGSSRHNSAGCSPTKNISRAFASNRGSAVSPSALAALAACLGGGRNDTGRPKKYPQKHCSNCMYLHTRVRIIISFS